MYGGDAWFDSRHRLVWDIIICKITSLVRLTSAVDSYRHHPKTCPSTMMILSFLAKIQELCAEYNEEGKEDKLNYKFYLCCTSSR